MNTHIWPLLKPINVHEILFQTSIYSNVIVLLIFCNLYQLLFDSQPRQKLINMRLQGNWIVSEVINLRTKRYVFFILRIIPFFLTKKNSTHIEAKIWCNTYPETMGNWTFGNFIRKTASTYSIYLGVRELVKIWIKIRNEISWFLMI